MRNLLLIIIVATACGYYFMTYHTDKPVTNYQLLLKKIDVRAVTFEEVRIGFHQLATQTCSENSFQTLEEENNQSCDQIYYAFKSLCEESVIGLPENTFSNKEHVTKLAEKFLICVGVG